MVMTEKFTYVAFSLHDGKIERFSYAAEQPTT